MLLDITWWCMDCVTLPVQPEFRLPSDLCYSSLYRFTTKIGVLRSSQMLGVMRCHVVTYFCQCMQSTRIGLTLLYVHWCLQHQRCSYVSSIHSCKHVQVIHMLYTCIGTTYFCGIYYCTISLPSLIVASGSAHS